MKITKFKNYLKEDLNSDPYNEENWEEEDDARYNDRQKAYLGRVENELLRFNEAKINLLNVWLEDVDYDIELNELLGGESYPFDKSLEDINIKSWIDDFLKKIK